MLKNNSYPNTVNQTPDVLHDDAGFVRIKTIAAASLFLSGVVIGVASDLPNILKSIVQTQDKVQEESHFEIDIAAIEKHPLPVFGYVFAFLNGEWHTIKTFKYNILGKKGETGIPTTGKMVTFNKLPVVVQSSGDGLDAYSFKKGELDPETNRYYIDVEVVVPKLRHTINYLEGGYDIAQKTGEEEATPPPIVIEDDPSTKVFNHLTEYQGDFWEAVCSGATNLIGIEPPAVCNYFGAVSESNAIKDAEILAAARQAGQEALDVCLNEDSVREAEQNMITSAVQEDIGSQADYPEPLRSKLIRVVYVDGNGNPTNTSMQPYQSVYQDLVKKGILTWQSLEEQDYDISNKIEPTCNQQTLESFTQTETDDTQPTPTPKATTSQVSYSNNTATNVREGTS